MSEHQKGCLCHLCSSHHHYPAVKKQQSSFTVEHSCGMWQLRRGDELGRVVIKTASMGKSISTRYPVGTNPRLKDVEARLMKSNAAQFGMPNAKSSESAGQK